MLRHVRTFRSFGLGAAVGLGVGSLGTYVLVSRFQREQLSGLKLRLSCIAVHPEDVSFTRLSSHSCSYNIPLISCLQSLDLRVLIEPSTRPSNMVCDEALLRCDATQPWPVVIIQIALDRRDTEKRAKYGEYFRDVAAGLCAVMLPPSLRAQAVPPETE